MLRFSDQTLRNKEINLQKVIQIIANAIFIVANITTVRAVTEASSSRLVNIYKV